MSGLNNLIFPPKGLSDKILIPLTGKFVRGIEGFNLSYKPPIDTTGSYDILPDKGVNFAYLITGLFANSLRDANRDDSLYLFDVYDHNNEVTEIAPDNLVLDQSWQGQQWDILSMKINDLICRRMVLKYSLEDNVTLDIKINGYYLQLGNL